MFQTSRMGSVEWGSQNSGRGTVERAGAAGGKVSMAGVLVLKAIVFIEKKRWVWS